MNAAEYTEKVLSCLVDLTGREREAVRAELDGHMEDRILAAMEGGADAESAEAQAVAAMGNPEEVGRALQKQYPFGWLVVLRAAGAALAFTVLCVLFTANPLYQLKWNLEARFFPRHHLSAKEAQQCSQILDIRADVGSDQLYIYGAGTGGEVNSTAAEARIYYAIYDRRPLGYVSQWEMHFEDENGERLIGSGGSTSSAGGLFGRDDLQVPAGTERVYAVVDRYGEELRLEVPLSWEVTE